MREKTIEEKLVKKAKERGGVALKFVSPGLDGMPDRIVILPDGHVGFVEVNDQFFFFRLLYVVLLDHMQKKISVECHIDYQLEY